MGFLAYVVDTRVVTEGPIFVSDVPLVCEFPDVFPKELSSVPVERQVEFRIDLIPGVAPIAKAPDLGIIRWGSAKRISIRWPFGLVMGTTSLW